MSVADIAARGYDLAGQILGAPSSDNPFYPPGLDVPGYVPNKWTAGQLLPIFFGALIAYMGITWWLAHRIKPSFRNAPRGEQGLFLWFITSGGIHCFIEGYVAVNHATVAGSQAILSQLWKEYALSDSRYVISDPFMLCIEGFTAAVYGPLCYLTAIAIVMGYGKPAGSSGLRHIVQTLVSTAELYGVYFYYGTVALNVLLHGVSSSRPEFVYVWVYFIGFNAPWVVIPIYAIYQSVSEMCRVFREHDDKVHENQSHKTVKDAKTE